VVESVIIHAGAPKTATTYIQRGLHSNREVLAEHGVYLPMAGRLELEPNAVCHHHLAWALISPARYHGAANPWPALAAELAEVEAPVVILSSEAFSRVASKGNGADLVEAAARELCDNVTIVYFVRNQLSLMNSLYGQRVKSFRMVESFDFHTTNYRGRRLFDYEALLKPWYTNDELGFAAVPFTGSRDVDPLTELLKVAGVEAKADALVSEEDDVNSSLGPVGIEAARLLGCYLRGMFDDFDSEEMASKKLYRVSSARAQSHGWCDESYWGWTPDTAAETADYFAPANNRFAHDVWDSDWDIAMPVDRETSAVRLLDLPPPTIERVNRYVFSLGQRFAKLREEGHSR
jgi:hypothetical protein